MAAKPRRMPKYRDHKLADARARVAAISLPAPRFLDGLTINPALELVTGEDQILVWRSPHDGKVHAEIALPVDLLALKVIVEEIDPVEASQAAGVAMGLMDRAVRHGVRKGLILSPESRIRRSSSYVPTIPAGEQYLAARVFTLQWHITQECDLHCRHCYDRTQRGAVSLGEGVRIIDQLRLFCLERYVSGQVTFSGGNPFLHHRFLDLYRTAADRGLATAILGNPASRQQMEALLAIQYPEYVQVSLEGLEPHNDRMRGAGHFRRTLDFLRLLRELDIPSEVMLTLTGDNLEQVIPLGEVLRDLADAFTFNRVALFGSASGLSLPGRDAYARFLADYLEATRDNPVLALKDSLFNNLLQQGGHPVFDGCAGYGCGAAFNFVALLPDGEVHACRKFPSFLGNIRNAPLAAIYETEEAAAYREGSASCFGCELRPVCRGCPAITAGMGLDPFRDRDPYCFRDDLLSGRE